MIDFHCHLDLYPTPQDVARECDERKVYVLSVTTAPSAFEGTAALVPSGARIRTALGLHPELVRKRSHELVLFERLLPRTRYVGEVGLDASREHKASIELQRDVLGTILRLCKLAGRRIITLHSRGATGDLLDVLSAEPKAGEFVLHWYLGTPRQIARAAEMGCWFSVGPAMLLSERGVVAVRAMPRDRVIPESDGPFGKLNNRPIYPWEASSVVPQLSIIWGEPEEDVRKRMAAAFKTLVSTQVIGRPDASMNA